MCKSQKKNRDEEVYTAKEVAEILRRLCEVGYAYESPEDIEHLILFAAGDPKI